MEKKYGKATRDAYGQALVELGKTHPNVVVLDADLSKSTKTVMFQKEFPERHINVGIQEANMVGVASGLAAAGKTPFASSFSTFLISKGYDQIRMAISYSEVDVKLVGTHGGISIGEDGASQMSIEDLGLAMTFPKMTVMQPADEFATRALVKQAADHPGSVYMRTGRPAAPIIYNENTKFKIGKGIRLKEGKDVSIFATGLLVFEALQAAEDLAKAGIQASVIDLHTLKPLDEALILEEARKTNHVVVAEEHQIWGGLGSAVARFLSSHHPCKMEFVAIQDTYAESGSCDEILTKYGLTAPSIFNAAKKVLA
jgi:transketolase